MSTLSQFVGGGGIKSIQKGYHAGSVSETFTITISAVNPGKCVVLLNSSYGYGDSAQTLRTPALSSLTSTSLTITRSSEGSSVRGFSWQVVEYE